MDFDNLLEAGIDLSREHPLWALLAVAVIAVMIYWKPKGVFKVALAGFTLAAIVYVFAFLFDLTSRGIDDTEKFTSTPDVRVD